MVVDLVQNNQRVSEEGGMVVTSDSDILDSLRSAHVAIDFRDSSAQILVVFYLLINKPLPVEKNRDIVFARVHFTREDVTDASPSMI